jgi:hypothetical protein
MAAEFGPNGLTLSGLLYSHPTNFYNKFGLKDSLSSSDNLNDFNSANGFSEFGWYGWNNSSTTPINAPSSYCVLLVTRDSNQTIQLCFGTTSHLMWVRRADSGNFYAWTQI